VVATSGLRIRRNDASKKSFRNPVVGRSLRGRLRRRPVPLWPARSRTMVLKGTLSGRLVAPFFPNQVLAKLGDLVDLTRLQFVEALELFP
jgi:hypothetical protein